MKDKYENLIKIENDDKKNSSIQSNHLINENSFWSEIFI